MDEDEEKKDKSWLTSYPQYDSFNQFEDHHPIVPVPTPKPMPTEDSPLGKALKSIRDKFNKKTSL